MCKRTLFWEEKEVTGFKKRKRKNRRTNKIPTKMFGCWSRSYHCN